MIHGRRPDRASGNTGSVEVEIRAIWILARWTITTLGVFYLLHSPCYEIGP